jgi:hypothetical protein
MLDYNLLFMLFSVFGGCSVCPVGAPDYVPRGWVGESHVVLDTHVVVLQIDTSSFETGWWREILKKNYY